jgi:uncharacterized membrane protein YccC
MLREIPGALGTELCSLEVRGPRGRLALEAASSVAVAVLIALCLHADQPWWAAISAFMVTQSSLAASVPRAAMRIVGSALGAAVGVIATGWFAYDQPALCLCLFAVAWVGLFGFAVSRFAYAWLISAITGNLVVLMALDEPQTAFSIAVNRVAEVAIGTGASLLVAFLLPEPAPGAGSPAAGRFSAPPLVFWSRRNAAAFEVWLRQNWPLVLHACRGGLTVMLLPPLTNWLAPIGPSTMAITAVAVMSIPTTAILEPDGRTVVQRATHRVIGCVLGALLGLLCLHWVGDEFVVWLLLLMGGIWLGSQIQSGSTGVSYVGIQAALAFLLSMVQGQGPPLSITPGLDRFAGIVAGLCVLLVITMVISLFRLPHPPAAPARSD